MSVKQKTEMSLTKDQASDFLRKLADSFETGEDTVYDYGINLKNYGKLKLSIKPKYDQVKLKLDLKKYMQEEDDEEYQEMKGREKYKHLKKRMESYFKEINESLSNGTFPSGEIVSVFLKDSESMCTYKGGGEEFYAEYQQACSQLQEAYDNEDLSLFREKVNYINDLKDRCHARYK